MYLHLGSGTVVRTRDVVAVFDMDNATVNATTRRFLTDAQKKKRVVTVGEELPKSFVLCGGRGGGTVYVSPVSSQTIGKRAGRRLDEESGSGN